MTLLHVTTATGWAALQREGIMQPNGFWHLCTLAQLPFVLERHFAGRTELVVLRLDPDRLGDVRWERSEPGMDPFPHLYGPLRTDAVLAADTQP